MTSAAMILAATFGVAGLTGLNDQVKELGSAMALGVLLDTFLARGGLKARDRAILDEAIDL